MSSSFFGFTIGLSALNTSKQALEVISHNIANMNTEGYSRQEAVLKTDVTQFLPSLNRSVNSSQLGSGVQVEEVRRLNNEFCKRQISEELQNQGKWETSVDIIEEIETLFSEPNEDGLSAAVDTYWNSWKALESNPEDASLRKSLVENTKSLTNFLNGISTKITQMQSELNTEIDNKCYLINDYAQQITDLNKTIKSSVCSGGTPNDLLDKRDVLVEELSKIVNINIRESDFGQIDVFIGGDALVRNENCYKLESNLNTVTKFYDITWENSGEDLQVDNGQLYSLMYFRDDYLKEVTETMDNFTSLLISETNELHQTGYGLDGTTTGLDFFTGTNMKDINLNPVIYSNTDLIAAAKIAGSSGDNSNIQDILSLRTKSVFNGGTLNFNDYYNNMIIKMGTDGQQSSRELENVNLLLDKLNARDESVSGVSLDEELVDLVKYQQAYNAAAKIITTMEEIFDVIINQL
jgi:flagellar hook-associated protein 1 FlgK